MPQRFLRPGITNSERWNNVSWEAQSFYIRILTLVDDFGRYDARVAILHGQCFALRTDVKPQRTAALRSELQRAELIDIYEVEGREYLQVTQWQERSRTERSKFPEKLQVVDISTPAAERSGTQESAASIDHRPSPLHHRPSTIDHRPSRANGAVADDDWIDDLAKLDCYKPVSIRDELGKAQTWCATNTRQCSRRFFTNWLNRAVERVKTISTNGTNRPPNSPRNVGHNANLSYANRPKREAASATDRPAGNSTGGV